MFMFGEFIDSYGHFGNMPEVPEEERREQKDGEDVMMEGCLRMSCVLCAMILGVMIWIFFSLVN